MFDLSSVILLMTEWPLDFELVTLKVIVPATATIHCERNSKMMCCACMLHYFLSLALSWMTQSDTCGIAQAPNRGMVHGRMTL